MPSPTPPKEAVAAPNQHDDWSPNPRQIALLEEVRARGAVSVERLALRLNVTMQTVRRDVQRLADAGLLLRFHGGVSLPRAAPSVGAWKERQALRADAKARIARSVVTAIPDGASIMLGNGTTVEAIARELLRRPGLRIITHNLHAAQVLSEHPDCKLHVAGGILRTRDCALEGDNTVAFLQQFKVDITIQSTMGIDPDGTMRDIDLRELPVAQAMMTQARECWLATDVSKFNQAALAESGRLHHIKRVFTEALPPAPFPALLQEAGVALTIAP
ncbi:MAG: DeoR/GlpR family DNA-binding transcription regulator [Aquabacterium sp.]|uniref:DeoR/GlpR family DNA-binding transcription regulator n=1 Tax=Aquabacterium sp. TaxID=1872578 RepID=UPI00271BEF3C|nr:DeoR/GlpR family DNA-binding transcription regulator [Aquabacterium sp.]MDO9004850.1 DeoR/GlpR family DNA-binding transcription regulator [Aquabacterium sp.]